MREKSSKSEKIPRTKLYNTYIYYKYYNIDRAKIPFARNSFFNSKFKFRNIE